MKIKNKFETTVAHKDIKNRNRTKEKPLTRYIAKSTIILCLTLLSLILLGIFSPTIDSNGVMIVDTSNITDGSSSKELHTYCWKYSSDCPLTKIPSYFGYKDTSIELSIDLDEDWYDSYRILNTKTIVHDAELFITVEDPYCIAIADALMDVTSNLSERERIDVVLRFVQSLDYQSEDVDYWKYPAETLWEKKGDCEDKAFLFVTLVRLMGYDSIATYVTIDFPSSSEGNVAAGVALDDLSGFVFVKNEKEYIYCETTSSFSLLSVGAILPFYHVCEWWSEDPLSAHLRS